MPLPKKLADTWAFPAKMTLRQYYAGLAMQCLVTESKLATLDTDADVEKFKERIADGSVQIADALITFLEKNPPK